MLLLATGDVIAHSRRPGQESVASGAELVRRLGPGLLGVDVVAEDVLAEPGWDISPGTLLSLARRARTAILEQGFDGVVVTHGTDTLEESAFLADLLAATAADRGGIVFTGAMRCLDDPATDGPANLASAILAAADPALRGVGAVACLNGELHAARWVTMIDATGPVAFSSSPYPPLGRVVEGQVELLTGPPARPPRPEGEPEPDVALVKTYPGIDPVLLTSIVDAGARGIVLEGTGPGNVPVELFGTIQDLIQWDIPVVVASRSRTRTIALDELPLGQGLAAKMGAIGARGLAPVKARVALMVALGGGGVTVVRDWFSRL
ncbi:asparaginase [Micromonospora sonneratiae]